MLVMHKAYFNMSNWFSVIINDIPLRPFLMIFSQNNLEFLTILGKSLYMLRSVSECVCVLVLSYFMVYLYLLKIP